MLKRKTLWSEFTIRAPIKLIDSDIGFIRQSVQRLKSASPIAIESFINELCELLAEYRHYQRSRSALTPQKTELSKLQQLQKQLLKAITLYEKLKKDPGIQLRLELSEEALFPVNYWDEINQHCISPRHLIADRTTVDRPLDSLNSIFDIVTVASLLRLPNPKPKGGRPTDLLRLRFVIRIADLYERHFRIVAKATEKFKDLVEIACRYAELDSLGIDDFVKQALSHRKKEKLV